MNNSPIRIQKLLANQNVASRRKIESLIEQGRILINGQVAQLGDKASTNDEIKLDGKKIQLKKTPASIRIILYHKPEGEICSNYEPFHENTVFDNLPHLKQGRWVAVGRLDINTSGLLIFTNDGNTAHQLMHPKHEWERIYLARVRGKLNTHQEKEMLAGISIENYVAKCSQIKCIRSNGANNWYQIGLYEGKNREVKKMFEYYGLSVSRLKRIQYGPYSLPTHLKPKQVMELSQEQINQLENK